MVLPEETIASTIGEVISLLFTIIISLRSSLNPLFSSISSNNGIAESTYNWRSLLEISLITLAVGVIFDFKSGLDLEYNTPFIILSTVCLVQCNGRIFSGSDIIPILSYGKVSRMSVATIFFTTRSNWGLSYGSNIFSSIWTSSPSFIVFGGSICSTSKSDPLKNSRSHFDPALGASLKTNLLPVKEYDSFGTCNISFI